MSYIMNMVGGASAEEDIIEIANISIAPSDWVGMSDTISATKSNVFPGDVDHALYVATQAVLGSTAFSDYRVTLANVTTDGNLVFYASHQPYKEISVSILRIQRHSGGSICYTVPHNGHVRLPRHVVSASPPTAKEITDIVDGAEYVFVGQISSITIPADEADAGGENWEIRIIFRPSEGFTFNTGNQIILWESTLATLSWVSSCYYVVKIRKFTRYVGDVGYPILLLNREVYYEGA